MSLSSSIKKSVLILTAAFALVTSAAAENWVLAAEKFTFTQKSKVTSTQDGIASLLPQLIMEQISSDVVRITTSSEMADRQREELLNKRTSLFLQLSKEVQVRDSLVLSESNPKKLQKLIDAQNLKIQELQQQIDENLQKQKQLLEELNNVSSAAAADFNPFEFFTSSETLLNAPQTENVTLYKNDFSVLYSPGNRDELSDRQIEKKLIGDKINGLITGKITSYGDYFLVTVELTVYPGSKVIACITEIGNMDSIQTIASTIVQSMLPQIANAMPVKICFNFTPEGIAPDVKMKIDGVVYNSIPEVLVLDSGSHYFEFNAEGYNHQSFTFNFSNAPYFLVSVPFQKVNKGDFDLRILTSTPGSLYLNGQQQNFNFRNPVVPVTINGNAILGEYVVLKQETVKSSKTDNGKKNKSDQKETASDKTTSDENKSDLEGQASDVKENDEPAELHSFFYIPLNYQIQDALIVAPVKPVDNSDLLEQRRIMAYRGYTALVVSLPATFIAMGNYNTAYANYNAYGDGKDGKNIQRLNFWNITRISTSVISGAAAGFYVYELVRYFLAANTILPSKTKVINHNSKTQNDIQLQNSIETENVTQDVSQGTTENTDKDTTDQETKDNADSKTAE